MDIEPDNLETRFRTSLSVCGIRPPDRLMVGLSGGADSVALAVLLQRAGLGFTAVHLNHSLRGKAADADAEWCAEFCRSEQIPFECHRIDVGSNRDPGEGVEEAGRRLRLAFWREKTAEFHEPVALGHHADDALEDLLLRLARGANASGLTGLRPVRTLAGVRIVRPLLPFRRHEIEAYLGTRGISDWCCDGTNSDSRFRRNAVRHEWLPTIRQTLQGDGGLFRSMATLHDDADFLEAAARAALPPGDQACGFRNLHPTLLPRVLRLWLAREAGVDLVPRHQAIERLRTELGRRTSQPRRIPLGDGLNLVLDEDHLRVVVTATDYCLEWNWTETPHLEIPELGIMLSAGALDRSDIDEDTLRDPRYDGVLFPVGDMPEILTVRNWRPGDRIVPFGHHSPRKVKDIYSAAGIAADVRPHYPLVLAGDDVIWIAGLRRAEGRRVACGASSPIVELRRCAPILSPCVERPDPTGQATGYVHEEHGSPRTTVSTYARTGGPKFSATGAAPFL